AGCGADRRSISFTTLIGAKSAKKAHEKRAGTEAGPKIVGGLNRTRNNLARSVRAPGGWGAEESGALRDRARGNCHHHTARLGGALSEIWQQYDFINKSVIGSVGP